MSLKRFYELCDMLRQYLGKKCTHLRSPIFVAVQVDSFLYCISNKGCYRKTVNVFGISGASISGIIRRVSYAVTTFVSPNIIRLPTSEGEVQELTDAYLEAHGFSQFISGIDGTHIEITEPSKHYSGFMNRKGHFPLNVQAVCDYMYDFQDIIVKWPGNGHDARVFLNSTINECSEKRIIPPCGKILAEGGDSVPVYLLDNRVNALLLFLLKAFSGGGRNERQKCFSYKLPCNSTPIENSFGRLKTQFRCLQRAADVKLDTLPQT